MKKKILYVEDDAESRALLARMLAGRYIVVDSGDPLGGIDLAKDTSPNLVLLDIDLPSMTGHDVAIRLRDLSTAEHVYQVVHPGLRQDFPALRSLEATPMNRPSGNTSKLRRSVEILSCTDDVKLVGLPKRRLGEVVTLTTAN